MSEILGRILKKDLSELDKKDIERLLVWSGGEERPDLEFKGFDVLRSSRDKIGKTVSAFANSSGGLIVIGIQDGAFDWGDAEKWPLERVEQILHRKIHPLSQIHCSGIQATSEPTSIVYVANVHTSQPLVAFSNRFYHRVGTSSLPMEPYEVEREMMARRRAELALCLTRFRSGGGRGPIAAFGVYVVLLNQGSGPVQHPYVLIRFGRGVEVDSYGSMRPAGFRGAGRAAQWVGDVLLPQTGVVISEVGINISQEPCDPLSCVIGAEGVDSVEISIRLPHGLSPKLPKVLPLLAAPNAGFDSNY
jgi:hypothetical protein